MTIDWTVVSIIVNAILAVFTVLLSLIIKGLASAVSEFKASIVALEREDAVMAGKIAGVELLVAGQYVKRDEFNATIGKQESQWQRELARVEAQVAARRISDLPN